MFNSDFDEILEKIIKEKEKYYASHSEGYHKLADFMNDYDYDASTIIDLFCKFAGDKFILDFIDWLLEHNDDIINM